MFDSDSALWTVLLYLIFVAGGLYVLLHVLAGLTTFEPIQRWAYRKPRLRRWVGRPWYLDSEGQPLFKDRDADGNFVFVDDDGEPLPLDTDGKPIFDDDPFDEEADSEESVPKT